MGDLLTFPRSPRRAWRIRRLSPGVWRGERIDNGRVVCRTEDGPIFLVDQCVNDHRCGLPILEGALTGGGRAA